MREGGLGVTPRFIEFMPFIIQWEGTIYENDPDDPGGATKYGIDKRSHPKEDISHLTLARAYEIYFKEYWTPLRCEDMPERVGDVLMNIGVNAGKSRAAKWLQRAVETTEDGIIGPFTMARVFERDPKALASDLIDRTEEHYRSIARGRLAKFLKGWLNRNESLRKRLGL